MDTVRFGRALGYGTRQAARALVEAAKAAAAPSPGDRPGTSAVRTHQPSGQQPPRQAGEASDALPTLREAGSSLLKAHQAVSEAQAGIKTRARTEAVNAGRSMLSPVKRAGGILWLEMTGCAFSLFALFLAPGLWKLRSALHAAPSSPEAEKFYLYFLVLVLFTYFAISSFVRAHRRGKRP